MAHHKHSIAPAVVLTLPLVAAAPLCARYAVGLPGLARRPGRTPGLMIDRALDAQAGEPAGAPVDGRSAAADERYDWKHAGIGAGGAEGLAALFLGAGLPVPYRRRR